MRFSLLLFLISLYSVLPGQQPASFRMDEAEFEGIQIYDVIQDEQLNYFFATDNGVIRFDGLDYRRLTCDGMNGNSVFSFVRNSGGDIFCHNLNHQVFRIRSGECALIYEIPEPDRASFMNIAVSSRDELLVVTRGMQVLDSEGRIQRSYPLRTDLLSRPFLDPEGRSIMHRLGKDSLLVLDEKGIATLPLKREGLPEDMGFGNLFFIMGEEHSLAVDLRFHRILDFNPRELRIGPVLHTLQDERSGFIRAYGTGNDLWIAGTLPGLVRWRNESRSAEYGLFPDDLVSDIYEDHEGNLLLSTLDRGLIVIPDLEITEALEKGPGEVVTALHHDPRSGLFLGTAAGNLYRYDEGALKPISSGGRRQVEAIRSQPGIPVLVFDDGTLNLMDMKSGQVARFGDIALKDAVFVSADTMYAATNLGLVTFVRNAKGEWEKKNIAKPGEFRSRSYAVAVDTTDGTVYVATTIGLRARLRDGTVVPLYFRNKEILGNCLRFHEGSLFVSTKNEGLLEFRELRYVRSIVPEIKGHAVQLYKFRVEREEFLGNSENGLIQFDQRGKVIKQINRSFGLATRRVTDFERFGEELWICHRAGIQKLHADKLSRPIERPVMQIQSVQVNDKPVDVTAPGQFSSIQRKFQFLLASPTLRHRENTRYHYRLQGYEDHWNVADYTDNRIVYNALAPGKYTFRVKAGNQGVFSKTLSWSFSISAPFYFEWWFFALCALFIVLIMYLVFRWQAERQRRKERLLSELNMSRLKAIQSQMNPHFIFNSLNSIQDLVLRGDVDNSYTFITKFSRLVRRTLSYSEKDLIPIEDEIAMLELYLSLEKLRFKEDFEYEIDAGGVSEIEVPPMLIQPFIENALVHGLLHKSGLRQLSVKFSLGAQLECEVEDNGVGREEARRIKERQTGGHESFATTAIARRFEILALRYGSDIGVEYEDKYENGKPMGTKVIIRIPFRRQF